MNKLAVILVLCTFVGFGCSSNAKKNTMDPAPAAPEGPKVLEKSAPAKEAAASAKSTGAVMNQAKCSVKGDVRTLEVREAGKGCELAYSKMGNESIVATSLNGTEHCAQVAEKIKNKLSGSGFSCD
jgi:hypothetical protein